MPTDGLPSLIFEALPMLLVKFFSIILLLLHLSFSFVLMRQTKLMIRVLEAKISSTIYAVSIIHFFSSLFVLIWAILFV